MSLFGGDSRPPSPGQESDFSISTIPDDDQPTAHSESEAGTEAPYDDEVWHEERDEPEEIKRRESVTAESDGSEPSFRPNRYRGSDRAWRHLTQQERTLAHSLDQVRAADLSLHLYRTHHLKARLRPEAERPAKPWSRKSRWHSTNQSWYPDSAWTAWPLPPGIAPVGTETFADQPGDASDASTYRSLASSTAADKMREQLGAVFLARANDSWKQTRTYRDISPDPVVTRRSRSRSQSVAPSPMPSSPVAALLPPLSSPSFPIQGQSVKGEETKGVDEQDKDHSRPVFSADDDRSNHLLHPAVSHVMAKLDRLLLALHRSRQAQIHRIRDGGDTSDSSARSTSRSRSRSNKPARPTKTRRSDRPAASTPRQPSPTDHVIFDDSGEDETYKPVVKSKKRARSASSRASSTAPDSRPASPGGTKPRVFRNLGLRDWSEVLGMAALTGWNPEAIARAQDRCKHLFHEDMDLYTMQENGDSSADEAKATRHHLKQTPAQSASWPCPLANCFRRMQPLDKGFRWREHMRRAHKYDNDQIARLEQQLIQSGDIAPSSKRHHILAHNPRGWRPPSPLKCPHCPYSNHVYSAVNRLLDHFKRGHKYDPRIEDNPPTNRGTDLGHNEDATPDYTSSADEDSDDFMVGGVHNDGFLQPILRHANTRGKDIEQRAKRSSTRR